MHLFYMYAIHAPHELATWNICVHAYDCAEASKSCISTNIYFLSRSDFISFSWQFSRVNWIPTSFSLVSTAMRAEWMALYIRRCFFFCLDYIQVPYKTS